MISRRWRAHLTYFAMSVFLAWHAIAMLLAPVPNNNVTVAAFRYLFQPYLAFIGLDNNWDFFSPIGIGHQFRYVITDAAGKEHTFAPIEQFAWFQPTHRWHEKIYDQIMYEPEVYGEYFALAFCRKHAALKPVSIRLLARQEAAFFPADYLSGQDRWGDEFIIMHIRKERACPREAPPIAREKKAVQTVPSPRK